MEREFQQGFLRLVLVVLLNAVVETRPMSTMRPLPIHFPSAL